MKDGWLNANITDATTGNNHRLPRKEIIPNPQTVHSFCVAKRSAPPSPADLDASYIKLQTIWTFTCWTVQTGR